MAIVHTVNVINATQLFISNWLILCYTNPNQFKNTGTRPGLMAHICNLSTLGGRGGTDHLRSGVQDKPDQHDKTQSLLKIENQPGWWCMPVIPATQEAEAGGLL